LEEITDNLWTEDRQIQAITIPAVLDGTQVTTLQSQKNHLFHFTEFLQALINFYNIT